MIRCGHESACIGIPRQAVPLRAVMLLAIAFLLAPLPGHAQETVSPHGAIRSGVECSACHTTEGWRSVREPLGFDHDRQTRFPLTGRHADASCGGCHLKLRFDQPKLTSRECATCHLDVHQGRLSADCASCHNTQSFREAASIEQHARTRFPLTGAHIQISCESCHRDDRGGAWTALDTECWSCHRENFAAAKTPDHEGAGMPHDCTMCHATAAWQTATFEHASVARGFTLDGRHATMECAGCHGGPGGSLKWTPSGVNDCVACHRGDYDHEHAGSGFPLECVSCHTMNGWERGEYSHAEVANGFALLGKHEAAPCTDCHIAASNALKFQPTSQNDCVACHQADYDREHAGTGYPTNCERCHNTNGWPGADFNHAGVASGFDLMGRHATLLCTDCHTPPDFILKFAKPAGTADCVTCHRPEYDREHTGTGYPTTCLTCHDATDWAHAVFDHVLGGKGFPLLGAHAAAPCTSCHGPNNVLKFPQPANADDCIACHRTDYDTEHTGSGFPTTCLDCHTVKAFTGATFDHSKTAFALFGAHLQAQCSTCHGANNVLLFPKPAGQDDCVACHKPEYDQQHTGSGFPVTCADCHSTTTFTGATFDHSTTPFKLVGAHVQAQCSACHGANNVLLFPKPANQDECIACHQTDYDGKHAGSGIPTTCLSCHTTSTFKGAVFDHSTTPFPLVGAHLSAQCSSCHGANNVLKFPKPSSPDDCVACHQADYDGKHAGSGYPLTCLTCHNTTSFQGAVFNHDASFFPINSGSHQGKWSNCADCHPNSANLAVFTCLSCHEHSKSSMDSKHQGRSGYAYDSVKCLSCHPRGRS
jgi:Cytochrome c7 and related cytochrome c